MARMASGRLGGCLDSPCNASVHPVKGNILSDTVIKLVNASTGRQLGQLDIYTLSEFLRFRRLQPKPLLYYEITATELLIAATMAASKFLHDSDTEEASCNGTWANNFDIDLKTLNAIEKRFFCALDWNLFVSNSDLDKFLMRHLTAAVRSGRRIRSIAKRHHPGTIAKRISAVHFDHKIGKVRVRWPMAKTMAMFAAAFLALSHPRVSKIFDDTYTELLLPGLLSTPPVPISTFSNQSNLPFEQLIGPPASCRCCTVPQPLPCKNTPNGSICFCWDSVNSTRTHPLPQRSIPNSKPLNVGVS